MNYEGRDAHSTYQVSTTSDMDPGTRHGPDRYLMGANKLHGNDFCNNDDSDLGDSKESWQQGGHAWYGTRSHPTHLPR